MDRPEQVLEERAQTYVLGGRIRLPTVWHPRCHFVNAIRSQPVRKLVCDAHSRRQGPNYRIFTSPNGLDYTSSGRRSGQVATRGRSPEMAIQPSPAFPMTQENAPQSYPEHPAAGPEAAPLEIADQMDNTLSVYNRPVGARESSVIAPVTAPTPVKAARSDGERLRVLPPCPSLRPASSLGV